MMKMITRYLKGRDEFNVMFEFVYPAYPKTNGFEALRVELLTWARTHKVKQEDFRFVEYSTSLFLSFRDPQVAMIFRLEHAYV